MAKSPYHQPGSERGHTIVVVFAALVVIAAGVAGWQYVQSKQTTQKRADAAIDGKPNQSTKEAVTDPAEGGKYLAIPEWGVRVLLPTEVQGDVYASTVATIADQSPDDAHASDPAVTVEYVEIRSKKLDSLVQGIPSYSLFSLARTKQEFPDYLRPYVARNIKQIDDTWFTVRPYKGGAVTNNAFNDYANKIYQPVLDAMSSVERY